MKALRIGLLALEMPVSTRPGSSHGHDGARAKHTAAGTVSHQVATITVFSRKRFVAQAPGM